jgi:hypothetical protein
MRVGLRLFLSFSSQQSNYVIWSDSQVKIVCDSQPQSPIIGGIVIRAPNDDPLGQKAQDTPHPLPTLQNESYALLHVFTILGQPGQKRAVPQKNAEVCPPCQGIRSL